MPAPCWKLERRFRSKPGTRVPKDCSMRSAQSAGTVRPLVGGTSGTLLTVNGTPKAFSADDVTLASDQRYCA